MNPYKVCNFILKNREGKDISILGRSREKNKATERFNTTAMHIMKAVKNSNQLNKDNPHKQIKIEGFDPYYLNKQEHEEDLYNKSKYILAGVNKFIFIGCPHDFIKEVEFHKDAIILDLWGIVKDHRGIKIYREI